MANLLIRNDPAISSLIPEIGYQFDPFQTIREMLRWDPLSDLTRGWPTERVGITFNPLFDVRETNDAFVLQADMPGVVEKDLDISLTHNRLVVSGKRESEQEVKGETYYRSERTYGTFSRSFNLPSEVDANRVNAELKHGVLFVNLPKTGESMARKITIHAEKK